MSSSGIVTAAPKVIWAPHKGSQELAISCPADEILYHGSRGPGKGLPLDEPVYTEKGPCPIGELKVGDSVACPDGTCSKIIGVYPQGIRPVYEITFFDGSISRCDDQHIWPIHVQDGNSSGSKLEYGYSLMTMDQVIDRFNSNSCKLHVPTLDSLRMRYKVHSSNNKLPVDPYLLGLILGDGTFSQQGSFCTIDNQLAEYVLAHGGKRWANDSRNELQNIGFGKELQSGLSKLNMKDCRSETKFIPEQYLHHSDENRLSVLQGLMDTDGTIDKKGYITFTSISEDLSKGVQYLVRSLGGNATLNRKNSYFNGTQYKDCFEVYIQPGNKFVPFRLERKVSRIKPYMHKKLWKRIESIVRLEDAETVCIKIDHPLGLFITRDFVVTHNTDAQLLRFRSRVGQGYGKFWRGIILDREYKNLDDIISKSLRWFPMFKGGARFLSSASDYRWIWPTGEELLFRHMKVKKDYWAYHGQEFPFIGWNELTKHASGELYDLMLSCNRSSFIPEEHPVSRYDSNGKEYLQLLPDIPLEVFSTCNPDGPGHTWVKKRWINAAPAGKFIKTETKVFDPRSQKEITVVKRSVHIFGSYKENRHLSPQYVATLHAIKDENKKKAWLGGSWDIVSGGMFDGNWDSRYNVVRPFAIPSSWRITRSFDWGSSAPFSVGWWAVSDGTEYRDSFGNINQTVRGDLFRISEWYGSTGEPNEGLCLLATQIATGIVERELMQGIRHRVVPGPADSSIYDVEDGNSIARNMEKPVIINGQTHKGVQWVRANKGPGSRIAGWDKMREMMSDAKADEMAPREKPGLFVFDICKNFIELVPILPRDEDNRDDVDTTAEDHIGDEARYMILDLIKGQKSGKTKGT